MSGRAPIPKPEKKEKKKPKPLKRTPLKRNQKPIKKSNKRIKVNYKTDRNPSIMERLYPYEEGMVPHEIYHGAKNRLICCELGLWVWLWHDTQGMKLNDLGMVEDHVEAHKCTEFHELLKKQGQERYEELFSREEFIYEIGRNYLD